MAITVTELMDRGREVLEQHRAEATALNAVFKFVLDGDGGGTFLLNLKDSIGMTQGDGPANVTMYLAVDDFVEMAEGRVDSRTLFFCGKLRVDGDMGLALKLKKLRESVR